MRRSRALQSVAILAGLAAITYILISLYLPSARWLIFGINKRTGEVRTVEQRVTFLPPYEYYRLKFEKRDGYAQRDDFVQITSKEGVPVKLHYRLRFGIAGEQIKDADETYAMAAADPQNAAAPYTLDTLFPPRDGWSCPGDGREALALYCRAGTARTQEDFQDVSQAVLDLRQRVKLWPQVCKAASQLDAAIIEALERDVPHPNAVRLALERRRDDRQQAPPVALTLPAHVQARDKAVRAHSLEIYDQLKAAGHEEP